MSTDVRTACPSCGTVEVPIGAARLVVGFRGADDGNRVEFDCPNCGSACCDDVGERATRLLSAAGITVVTAAPGGDALSAGENRRGDAID
ncbi:MAG: hypothetical protein ACRDTS_24720 [Mycobacterium sp.]